MSDPCQPEMGQMLFGCPTGAYDTGTLGRACIQAVLRTVGTAFWNHAQREWDGYEDPQIPGLTYRPYYWGDDEAEAAKPNLQVDGDSVEIRWYKYAGRGETVNQPMTPEDWNRWVNRAMKLASDHQHSGLP